MSYSLLVFKNIWKRFLRDGLCESM